MKLLALETSTHMLSVALSVDEQVVQKSEFCINGGSDRLLPWVQQLLAEAGVSLHQLDAIAFGSGPGSFTGLRMACSAAQGLAYGADLPVIPVVTLAALAHTHGPGHVFTCLDARMNEVYCAAYDVDGDSVVEMIAPSVSSPEFLAPLDGDGWMGCGDGFGIYREALTARLGGGLKSIDANIPPLAPAVLKLAAVQWRAGSLLSAADAVPLYVRNKVALTTQERLARGGSK